MAQEDESASEKIGFGRPPKKDQIKKGEVRNPWGRKGKPGTKKDFMEERFKISIDGVPQWVTRDEAVNHALFNAAMKGNVSAVTKLEDRQRQCAREENNAEMASALLAEDKAALDRYVRRFIANGQTLD